ncbi:Squalene/phytoene synthase, partial [mine drainage metagenome]
MPADANDLWYCREKIGPWGTIASLAVQFAPRNEKDRLTGVFALQNEWEAIAASRNARELAPVRLAWWREELQGKREHSTHPVIRLLTMSHAFDSMPIARLHQALGSFLELTQGRNPVEDPQACILLCESRGTFLHWTTLNRMEKIPDPPIQHLAAAVWFIQQLAPLRLQAWSPTQPSGHSGTEDSGESPP